MITRNQIISEAKSWLHTPFHPQARIKSVGCDCIGLIVRVAQKLKIGDFELLLPQNYNYFQDRTYFLECLKSNLKTGIKRKGMIAVSRH